MADGEYRRLTCGGCNEEFTQAGRGRNAKTCSDCRAPKPKIPPQEICRHCGGRIEKPRHDKIYCSKLCAYRAKDGTKLSRAEYRQMSRANAVVGKFTCEHCGNEAYRPLGGSNRKRGTKNRFCSMACRKDQAAERERVERARREFLRAVRRLARLKESQDRRGHPTGYTPVVRTCKHCGLLWSALGWSGSVPYCPSPECQAVRATRKQTVRRLERRKRGNQTHIGRAKKLGRRYRYFNPMKVFERDGWTCQICGVRTPRRLRGSLDPRAPELDHIVPLAAGGDHLPENCQCACRRCNGLKGAKPFGQMLLIG